MPDGVLHIPPTGAVAGQSVAIEAIVDGQVVDARIYHRVAGSSGYLEEKMSFAVSTWQGKIPGNFVSERGLEYAIVFTMRDGSSLGYPRGNAVSSPQFVNVIPAPPRAVRVRQSGRTDESTGPRLASQAIVLSPDEGEVVAQGDVLLAVSLFSVDGVDPGRIKFFIDGRDVTAEAEITVEVVTYTAPELKVGLHTASVEVTNIYGYELEPTTWSFMVGGTGSQIVSAIEEFSLSGKFRSDFSLNQVSGTTLSIGETSTTLEAGWEWFKVRTEIKWSTQESPFSQPKNRLSTTIQSSDFVTVRLGDFTPVLNPYLVQGKRVRGIGTDLDLKWLKLQFIRGELERPVQGFLTEDRSYELTEIKTDSTNSPQYVLDRRGYTFGRQYMAGRFGLSLFRRFDIGIFGQKAKDEASSVLRRLGSAKFTVPDWRGAVSVVGIDSGLYSLSELESALEGVGSIDLPDKNWGGDKPMDNLVTGFDLGFSFDNRRLIFESAWAMSLLNRDIWDGAMNVAQMDTSLDDSLDGYIGRSYNELGEITGSGVSIEGLPDPTKFEDVFIANINMTPLVPIDYQALAETPMAAVLNMPSSAYHLKTRAFYYGNTIEMKYSQVGPEFTSLANPYLSSNLREFVFSDRLRVFDNKLTVGYEYKNRNNKVLRTVVDPYKQKTSTMTFAFAPGAGMTSFSASFQNVERTNEKTNLDTLVYTSYTGKDSIAFRDNRENTLTGNRFLSVSIPIRRNGSSYNFLMTYNSIGVEDILEKERASDYVQKAANSEAISLITSAKFASPLQATVTLSRYKVQIPMAGFDLIDSESRLTTIGTNGSYGLWGGRAKVSVGLSLLNATGVSKFTFIGLNGGAELKPFNKFVIRASTSSKIKSTEKGTEVGTLAVKLSANYVF
ncbi:MAG: hypothetical protein CMG71_08345 [Candidatus Marinimicrobia bacterium]|nr:hypothetical protein [Candidatus Neomarinimicrobiota bacterium]|tara:strand:- start:4909 stop:7584 length:2676 start_codon:yes stop_codon:yes gene_type:complete